MPTGGRQVDPFEFYLGGKDVAQGGASGGVAVVDEYLAGNSRLAAYGAVDGGGAGVGHVFTVGVDFNYGAVAGNGMVSGILAGGIVGMEGVAVVGGDHER